MCVCVYLHVSVYSLGSTCERKYASVASPSAVFCSHNDLQPHPFSCKWHSCVLLGGCINKPLCASLLRFPFLFLWWCMCTLILLLDSCDWGNNKCECLRGMLTYNTLCLPEVAQLYHFIILYIYFWEPRWILTVVIKDKDIRWSCQFVSFKLCVFGQLLCQAEKSCLNCVVDMGRFLTRTLILDLRPKSPLP